MFHGSTTSVPLFAMRCPTVPASLFQCSSISFHCFTISCSIVPPLDVLLFHHLCSSVSPSDVPLLHDQMIYCSVISFRLFRYQMFYCSTIRCSNVPLSDVRLFHHLCSTVPRSDVVLIRHQMSHCFNTSVPLFHCSTVTVPPPGVLPFHH